MSEYVYDPSLAISHNPSWRDIEELSMKWKPNLNQQVLITVFTNAVRGHREARTIGTMVECIFSAGFLLGAASAALHRHIPKYYLDEIFDKIVGGLYPYPTKE